MQYKKIIAFGDSFTRGDELANCSTKGTHNPYFVFSTDTWPALLAKKLGIGYDCIALGGRGNQWISWAVQQCPEHYIDCLFIVNWTYFGRFDYVDCKDEWQTMSPNSNKNVSHEYYKTFDNDIWNLNRNIQIMYATLHLLKENSIDYIFTCQDAGVKQTIDTLRSEYVLNNQTTWRKSISSLSKPIVSNITDFEGLTFREWADKHDYPVGPGGHPLEKAHAEAAKYINTNVIEGMTNEHR